MSASELTVEQVGPTPDHVMTVVRGMLDETTAAQLGSCSEQALDTNARYLVADPAQVTGCDLTALPAPDGSARRPTPCEARLQLVATSNAVIAALDTTDSSTCSTSTAPPTEPALRPDLRRPGMPTGETGQRHLADSAVTDLHGQVRALQAQLLKERAETARLRNEVAQLRTQIHEGFEMNDSAAQAVTGRRSLQESAAEAMSTARLLISRDKDAAGAIAVLKHWRGASPELDRELVDLMAEHDDISGLRELADDNDSAAAVRLAELLCERQEIEAAISTLKQFAQRSHAASEFLVRLLSSQEDLQSLCELATAGNILAAKQLVELAVSRGSYDDLNTAIRTLAVMERDVGGCYPITALTRLRQKRHAWEHEREQVPAAGQPQPQISAIGATSGAYPVVPDR
jgi:hypothetical protein